jgi:vacuolar-type H+-ATPase subunit E/Vma4
MGHIELIESLRTEGEKKTLKAWQEAEAEIDLMRSERAKKIQQLKDSFHEQYRSIAHEQSGNILDRAYKEARQVRLASEQSLSHRLYALCCSLLFRLRNARHKKLFIDLAGELPQHTWTVVRVHPVDTELAGTVFPGAKIISDNAIAGGLTVASDNGKIRIDNTFEKRLERAWTFILPEIMKDVCDSHGTAQD